MMNEDNQIDTEFLEFLTNKINSYNLFVQNLKKNHNINFNPDFISEKLFDLMMKEMLSSLSK